MKCTRCVAVLLGLSLCLRDSLHPVVAQTPEDISLTQILADDLSALAGLHLCEMVTKYCPPETIRPSNLFGLLGLIVLPLEHLR